MDGMKEKFEEAAKKWVDKQSEQYDSWKIKNSKDLINEKVIKFSQEMDKELRNNEHKGSWEDFLYVYDIIKELDYHVEKLKHKEALVYRELRDKEELKESIADCANILLFLGNAYGLYDDKNL